MQIKPNILNLIEDYVNEVFEKSSIYLPYHNINHTYDVVESAKIIGNYENLTEEEFNILIIAAWFHDIGYLENILNHEAHSAKCAATFLFNHGIDTSTISTIKECILATKLNTTANNVLEKTLVDADLFNLGTEKHFTNSARLQEELSLLNHKKIETLEWLKIEIPFLKRHHYETLYGKTILEPIKQQHIKQRIIELNKLIR